MGRTIQIRGRLRDAADIARLVHEVSDLAETLHWDHEAFHDGKLNGLLLKPHPACETLALVFDRDGALRNALLPRSEPWIAVGTQEVPVDVHLSLIKLIRHLAKRYFAELEVKEDDGHREGEGEDLNSLLREPELPEDEVLFTWQVDDWIEYFEKHDRGRSSILRAMAGREETPEALAQAAKEAEAEEERRERATNAFLRRLMDEQVRRTEEEREFQADSADDEMEGPGDEEDAPWRESLPEYVRSGAAGLPGLDTAFAEVAAECPAVEDAHTFMVEIRPRLQKAEGYPPALDYLRACATTAVAGVYMGHNWARERGFPLAQTARYAIAAARFATVARLLDRFAVAGLQTMADRARLISDGFRTAAEEGPGGWIG